MNSRQKASPADFGPLNPAKDSFSKDYSTLTFLFCLWLLAFTIRLLWIWPLHYNDWFGDAAYNVRIAEDIAEGKDAAWVGRNSPFFVFTPLFHLLVALVIIISPLTGIIAAKVVSAFFTSFVPPALYILIYRLTEQKPEALTGALIATFIPWFLAMSVMTLATGLYIALAIVSCTAMICVQGNKRIPISLTFAGLAALSRPEGAFFLLFTMIWILIMAFRRKNPTEWRMALLSVSLVAVGVVAAMIVIWLWRADDPFVWIVSMLEHQADEAQKEKLTIAEFGYLFLIILATYSGFGGDPEPVKFDLYNVFRIGFAISLLLLMAYGFWVIVRNWRNGNFSKEVQEGYYFIFSSWMAMLVFLILLDGRWIKYHVLGVMMIQPLLVSFAVFDLARKLSRSPVAVRWLGVRSNSSTIFLVIILGALSIQFSFAFATNAFLKSQMWEPRREMVEWLNKTVPEDAVVVIPHREYYVTAYTQTSSVTYADLYDDANLTQDDLNQARLLNLLNQSGVLFLVITSDVDRQNNPYYSQIVELVSNRTTIEFTAKYEWRSLSIRLSALKMIFG